MPSEFLTACAEILKAYYRISKNFSVRLRDLCKQDVCGLIRNGFFNHITKGMIFMKCPYCSFLESKVIDSRPTDEANSIRRRRECLKCGKRFTTYEKIEAISIAVVKKDNSRQQFDRNKILKGIITACEKRPISLARMEKIVDDIESELYQAQEREIDTRTIGEKVLEKLKTLDDVAYVRFASVYKRFDDVETFMKELRELRGNI